MKKILLSPWLSLITLLIVIFIRFQDPSFVESIRLRYFDTLITSKPTVTSDNVVTVNIDDESLEKYGQFPFPRNIYGNIIEDLYERNAGLVVFNVFMPDADRFKNDSNFASRLQSFPSIFPQTGTNEEIKSTVVPFRPGVSVIGDVKDFTVEYKHIQPNVKEINDSAAGVGIVNTFPEIDGVVRRVPMVVSSGRELYPSISLETLRVASGDPSFQVKVNDLGIEAVRIPKFGKILTDSYSRIWVDWSHRPNKYSLVDLPKDFGGKIVIVGLTARGLNNPIASAIGEQYPHELQSSILDTLISGTNISRLDWAEGAEILALFLISIISILLTRWKYGFVPIFSIFYGIYFAGNYIYTSYGYLFDSTIIICGILLVYIHAYTVKFISELHAKLQIKKQFGTYLSPALVEKLQKNPELLVLGGESRELSIMFSDVRGFTSISEHYGKDVQGLTKIMNRYMTAMTAAIIKNDGTLDKYIGDAQMAFWNAPLDINNHAKQAVKTALEMLGSLDAFNKEVEAEGVPPFGMGLGINTEMVVVGNMGSDQRFDYTCLGDGVNLASRLEGQSKNYGVLLVLGPKTAEQVMDEYPVVEMDCIAVKGKKEGVKVYTIGNTEPLLHKKYLDNYYSGNWKDAIKFAILLKENSDIPEYYIKMIERMEEGKPKDWDGTYRATSK